MQRKASPFAFVFQLEDEPPRRKTSIPKALAFILAVTVCALAGYGLVALIQDRSCP